MSHETEQVPEAAADIDLEVYGMDSILKSAYRFSGRAYVSIEKPSGRTAHVAIKAKTQGTGADVLLRDFMNDLLDQRLRQIVASETAGIRDLIMAHALSSTDLVLQGAVKRSDIPEAPESSDKK